MGIKDFYSFDLTAATDRLPLILQAQVLFKYLGNSELVKSWMEIMVGIPFHLNTKHGKRPVFYAVGQGIGIYSS